MCLLLTAHTIPDGAATWQKAIQQSEELHEAGKLSEAEHVLLGVLRNEPAIGADGLAYIYNNLGSVCQDQTRFYDADRYYRRSVAEWERAGDAHRVALARTLNNLASLLWDTGKVAEAERILVRSANLQIAAAGSNLTKAADLFYNLGALYSRQKRWGEAEAAYRQVLSINDQPNGDQLQAAATANKLGIILKRMSRDAQADDLFHRARSIWKQSHDTSDRAALLLIDLAESFWSSNQQDEAECAVKQALVVVESRFGRTHPKTAQTLMLYATMLRKTDRKPEAREVEKRIKSIGTGDTQLRLSRQTIDISDLRHQTR
jgi:tetratricopeptide (TPR) repeat protein